MDIRQLSYFIEVAKQKSFTRASKVLHLSQPSLSKMVKSLEDELEVTLIDRSARQIELTDAGEIVFTHGQRIVESLGELSSLLYDTMHLKKGNVKIGLPPLIGVLFFPGIIKGFRDLYPEITIQLVEHGSHKVTQSVEEGTLDFGVVVLPVDEEKFTVVPFVYEKLMLFVHESHPLAAKREVAMKDLQPESFILFSEDFTLHGRIIQACRNAGFEPKIAYESSQWDFIGEMVSQELGISIFPESIAKKVNPNHIKAIPIADSPISWELGVILKKEKYVSYAAREFISYISSIMQPL
jgi:DNA-binding transcriptional LysR family regulator